MNIDSIQNWIGQQISCNFENKNCEELFGNGNSIPLALDLLNKIGNE